VRIALRDIEEATKELSFEEPTEELNALLARGPVQDYKLSEPAQVHVSHYRSGRELFFAGQVAGRVSGQCVRCLELYDFELVTPFAFVLVPQSEAAEDDEAEIDLSYYEGEEVDLSPLLRDRVLLSLPTRPLCAEDCRGLCPRCGANRNREQCDCPSESGDPRLAVLRGLRVQR
jgi:uncharacterized protein